MQTETIKVDPLLDLKKVKELYKLNMPTIKIIVNDDKMPVTWLGKKRYLRQSDLENYISKHTKSGSDTKLQEPPVKQPTKPIKRTTNQSTASTIMEPQKSNNTLKREAILTPSSQSKSDTKRNKLDMLQTEISRRKRIKSLSVA